MTSVPPPTRPELPEGAPPPRAAPPPLPPAVPLWVPFVVLAAVVIVIGLIGVAAIGVLAAVDASVDATNPPDSFTIALTVVQDIVFVLAAWIAVRLVRGGAGPGDFGLRLVPARRALAWAVGLYIGFWVIAGLLVAIFGSPPEQEIVQELKRQDAVAVLAGYAVLTCVMAPLAEEFFFRGFMFTTFARRLGPVWATVIVAIVFGLVHAPGSPLLGVVVLAVFGAALCILYWRLRSIVPGMALHALHNSISFAATKGFPGWGLVLLAGAAVGLVLAVAAAVARPARAIVARP
jgi:membrane protease YdiL (CAAX protease family)